MERHSSPSLLEEQELYVGPDGELESISGHQNDVLAAKSRLSDRIRVKLKREQRTLEPWEQELKDWWFVKFAKIWYLLVVLEYSAHIGLSLAQIPIPHETLKTVMITELLGPFFPLMILAGMADSTDH